MNPDRKISVAMQEIAEHLDKYLENIAGEHMGFSLVVFNAVNDSRMNYVSNCSREDVYSALSSLLKGWEEGMPDIPAHKVDG
jgi:hypothetical protein